MRLKDLERDEAFAWEVLKKAPYATLAMTGADGAPYCVPINHVADETYRVLYFHCAGAGEKWEVLKTNPQVCLTAVSRIDKDDAAGLEQSEDAAAGAEGKAQNSGKENQADG